MTGNSRCAVLQSFEIDLERLGHMLSQLPLSEVLGIEPCFAEGEAPETTTGGEGPVEERPIHTPPSGVGHASPWGERGHEGLF